MRVRVVQCCCVLLSLCGVGVVLLLFCCGVNVCFCGGGEVRLLRVYLFVAC